MADQEAPAVVPATDPKAAAAPKVEAPAPEAPPVKTYSQEEVDRIAEKVRKNAAYRAKRETEARLAGVKEGLGMAAPEKPAEPQQPAEPKEPQRADFADYESYIEARAEYRADRKVEERFAKQKEEAKAADTRTEQQKAQQRFMDEVAALEKEVPGARETLESSDAPLTAAMQEAIHASDAPARIAHYLAENPDEAKRIAALSSAKQGIEIGKLEVKVTASKPAPTTETVSDLSEPTAKNEAAQQPAKPAREPSKAPEPIKPVGATSVKADEMPDPAKNPDGWYKWRQAQIARQRSAAQRKPA